MDAAKCELSDPSLLLPSTNASQSCVHIVGHLMNLIHFTKKAAVMLLDYHFSLEECVYKAYLQTIPTRYRPNHLHQVQRVSQPVIKSWSSEHARFKGKDVLLSY